MANLGTASLYLTTNNSGLNNGLNKAERDVRGSMGRMGQAAKGGFSLGGFASKLGSVGKLAGAGLVAGIAAGVGVGLVNVVGDVIGRGMERLPEIAKVGELAKSFQTPIESFSALQGVAAASGSDIRDFQEALITLSKAGQDAAKGTGEAAETFKSLGIDVAKFNSLNAVEKFYMLNDALKGLDATTKGAAMGKLLGEDSMKNLTGLMNKTSDEIREMGKAYTITGEEAAKSALASEAMGRASQAISVAFDKLLISLTPVFEFVADLIPMAVDEMGGSFSGFGDWVIPVMRGIGYVIGTVWDSLKVGAGVAAIVAGRIVESFGVIVDTLGLLISLAADSLPEAMKPDWLNPMADAISKTGKEIEGFGQKAGKWGEDFGGAALNGFGDSATKIDQFFDKWESKRNKNIRDRAKELSNPKIGEARKQQQTAIDTSKTELAVRGSKEAANIELNARFRAISGGQMNEQKKQTGLQERMADALDKLVAKDDGGGAVLGVI